MFTVYANPLPKQSTRIAKRGGKVHTYTEPRIKDYQNLVSVMAKMAMEGRPPLEGKLVLHASFYRYDRLRVDLDNLCKCLCDSMNKIVQVDDCQFVEKHLYKKYDKECPRTVVVVKVVEDG